MTSGPLPPHERTWRHPSEVAAAQQAELRATPPGRDAQRLALGAGACIVAVVIVVMFVAIATQQRPSAVDVVASLPMAQAKASLPTRVSLPGEPIGLGRSEFGRGDVNAGPSLATPVGSGDFALVTTASLGDDPPSQAAIELPDQSIQLGEVLDVVLPAGLNGLSLVELTEPSEPFAVASAQSSADDGVVLIGRQHLALSLTDAIEMRLPEGSPILNGSGELVGISSLGSDGTTSQIILVDPAALDQVLEMSPSDASIVEEPQVPPVLVDPTVPD